MSRFVSQSEIDQRPSRVSTQPVLTDPSSIGGNEGQASAAAVKLIDAAATIVVRNRLEDDRRRKVNQSNRIRADMINGLSDIETNEDLSVDEKDVAVQGLTHQVLSGDIDPDVLSDVAPFVANQLRGHASKSFAERQELSRQDARAFVDFVNKDSDMNQVNKMLDEMLGDSDAEHFKAIAAERFNSDNIAFATGLLASDGVERDGKTKIIGEIASEFSTGADRSKNVASAVESAATATALRGDVGETQFLISHSRSLDPGKKQRLINLARRNLKVVSGTQRGIELISSGNPELKPFPDDDGSLNSIAGFLQSRGQTNAEVIEAMLSANAKRVAPTSLKRIGLDFNELRVNDGIEALRAIKSNLGTDESNRIARDAGSHALTAWQVTDHVSFRNLSPVDQAAVVELLSRREAPAMIERADEFLFGGTKELDKNRIDRGSFRDGLSQSYMIENKLVGISSAKLSAGQRESLDSLFRFEFLQLGVTANVPSSEITSSLANVAVENSSQAFLQRNTPVLIDHNPFFLGSGSLKFAPAFVGAGTGVVPTEGSEALQEIINGRLKAFIREDSGGILAGVSSLESLARVDLGDPVELNGKFYIAAVDESGVRAFARYDPLTNDTELITPQLNTQEFGQASIKFSTGADPAVFSDLFPFMRGHSKAEFMADALGGNSVDDFLNLMQDKFNAASNGRDYDPNAPASVEQENDTRLWNSILQSELGKTGFVDLYPPLVSPGESNDSTSR